MTDAQIELSSLRPYLIRAHHEWMSDNDLTPHLVVNAEREGVQVPTESIKDGTIVLNIALRAVRDLVIGNEAIEFNARFGGVPRHIYLPIEAVRGLVAREYGIGVTFPDEEGIPIEADEPAVATPESVSSDRTNLAPTNVDRTHSEPVDPDSTDPDSPDGSGDGGRKRPSLRIVK